MTDVVFIYPPWPVLDDRAILQNSLPPLGILSIASFLRDEGFKVKVYDIHAEKLDENELRFRLKKDRPNYVGISVLTNMCIPAHKIARIVKEELKACVVIAGGVHAEAMPERMLKNSSFDAVVRGDGEEPMKEIMQDIPFKKIPGLSYRFLNKVIHNPLRPINLDLDKYSFPAYDLVDFKNYFPAAGSYRNLPAINMLMTRGCPGKCTFCNSAKTTLRARSPSKVVEQIEILYSKYGIRKIQFYDDTFTVLKSNVLEFCRLLELKKFDLSWTAYIRGDCFSDEMALAMKKAGCHQVLMGIETGSPLIASRIGKPIDKKRYKQAVEIAHKHNLEVRASFIIGNMDETIETMKQTLDFAIELDVDLFQLNISTPYPGSALFKEAFDKGIINSFNWYKYGQGDVIIDQTQLSAEDIFAFERFAFRKFYLRPKSIYRMLKRLTNLRHIKDLILASYILIFRKHKKPGNKGKWDCWKNLSEDSFFDMAIDEPQSPRLTYQLRQVA